MRYLFLAFVGFLCVATTTGCGVIKTIAIDTCGADGNYNQIICPNILEEALPEAPAKVAPKAICHNASAFMVKSRHTTRVLSRSNGQCKEVRKQLQDRVRKVGPGVKCSWKEEQITCAGFGHAGGFVLLLLLLIRSRNKTWKLIFLLLAGNILLVSLLFGGRKKECRTYLRHSLTYQECTLK